MNIAEKLRDLRNSRGYSQDKLAEILGVSITAVRNYENISEPRVPKSEVLLSYSRHFNVSLEYLLDDNIINKTNENIDISKVLKLSDKTINHLKEFINYNGSEEYIKSLNDVLSTSFFINIVSYYTVLQYMNILTLLKEEIVFFLNYDEEKDLFFIEDFEKNDLLPEKYINKQKEHLHNTQIKDLDFWVYRTEIEKEDLFMFAERYLLYIKYLFIFSETSDYNFNDYCPSVVCTKEEYEELAKKIDTFISHIEKYNCKELYKEIDEIEDTIVKKYELIDNFKDLLLFKITNCAKDLIEYNYLDLKNNKSGLLNILLNNKLNINNKKDIKNGNKGTGKRKKV